MVCYETKNIIDILDVNFTITAPSYEEEHNSRALALIQQDTQAYILFKPSVNNNTFPAFWEWSIYVLTST